MTNSGTASGFGKVLQVVNATYSSQETTTSTSFVATSLTASITPSSASNKILVLVHDTIRQDGGNHAVITIYRNSTNLGDATWGLGQNMALSSLSIQTPSLNFLDTPSTTSSVTYTLYYRSYSGASIRSNPHGDVGSITLMEIAG
jgi:hypothetical protein